MISETDTHMHQPPHRITAYYLLNSCFLVISATMCLLTYFLVTHFYGKSAPLTQHLELFTHQLSVILFSSCVVFAILSWVCLWGASAFNRAFHSRKIDTRQEVTRTTSPPISNVTEEQATDKKTSDICIDNTTSSNATIRLLIVDDNPANIMVIDSYLRAGNRQIMTATSGEDALRLFEKTPADIIFMDMEMEGMNGPQTLQHIRALEKQNSLTRTARTPIIAVSANNAVDKKIDMLQQGFDDYLAKPVDPEKLNCILQRWQFVNNRNGVDTLPVSTTLTSSTHKTSAEKKHRADAPRHYFSQRRHNVDRRRTLTNDHKDLQKIVNIKLSLVHSNHDSQLAKDMLELLICLIKKEKQIIIDLCKAQDWSKLYQLNHKIYGGSSYCGVPQLQSANKSLGRLLQSQLTTSQAGKDSPVQQQAGITKPDGVEQAVGTLTKAIDAIILWDEQHDIDIIFNIN
ncbi:MAG: CheY-like chemotaxis protein [Candidatus Endobugula sp.]|jgi:CheY-like chemotaxis protein